MNHSQTFTVVKVRERGLNNYHCLSLNRLSEYWSVFLPPRLEKMVKKNCSPICNQIQCRWRRYSICMNSMSLCFPCVMCLQSHASMQLVYQSHLHLYCLYVFQLSPAETKLMLSSIDLLSHTHSSFSCMYIALYFYLSFYLTQFSHISFFAVITFVQYCRIHLSLTVTHNPHF